MIYAKPPITEAVIEFQFAGKCPESERNRVGRKLKKFYPFEENIQELTVTSGPDGTDRHMSSVGLKLSTLDRSNVVSLTDLRKSPLPVLFNKDEGKPASFSAAQLAPYFGWNNFCQKFVENWTVVERTIGKRKLRRIGVRFVNRIDIPGKIDDTQDWVRVGPFLPEDFGQPIVFNMHVIIPIDRMTQANLLVGTVPSPLPDYSSMILDIDIYTTGEIGDDMASRLEILEYMHEKKNWIFEDSITEATRNLFR
ncbi:TIGR04255 family protein [Novacetimonas hansenii]|uniref:TIGR04255 family protein n=1 Tax=Novacetimonas hansenii TaxID=436 RepID=UPI00094F9CCF|nr:TIGR04255 family protein [Novacetimonas hansenii]